MPHIRSTRHNEFSPADINAMDVALKNACAAAAGVHVSDEVREKLAQKIVSYALAGERDLPLYT